MPIPHHRPLAQIENKLKENPLPVGNASAVPRDYYSSLETWRARAATFLNRWVRFASGSEDVLAGIILTGIVEIDALSITNRTE